MNNLTKLQSLERIISSKDITVFFQPILDTKQQTIMGYEALSRGPKNSPLYNPIALFSAAKHAEKLSELELLCRETAIAEFVSKNLPGKLFLNVSPSTLLDASHPKGETLQLLAKYGLSAKRVVIELTEGEPFDNSELLLEAISHYRSYGLHIAIDDFGAGYSGLKQWSELKPDIVKIDRYFIDQCDKNDVKKEFLRFIIELAKLTNTRVIAEGIERSNELELLGSLGVELAQGYLLAKPALKPAIHYNDFVPMPSHLSSYMI
jgi:EAL domain-containing protein (putative c-di-GMP-specific phosphodiesterase class I)